MRYRAPVRRMPGFTPRGRADAAPAPSVFDAVSGISALSRILAELDQAKRQHAATIEELTANAKREIAAELARVRAIKQGEPGLLPLNGVHYSVPTSKEIVDEVMRILPKIRDGNDADEAAIQARVLAQVRADLSEVPSPEEVAALVLDLIARPKGDKGDSPDANALLEQLVQRIKDEKLLKPEHIDGLGATLQTLKTQSGGVMRGGGDTVLAGANVTITKNAAGRKVISAASGAGFTTLTASETPDGNITVFTFAAATAQPSALIVDNAWMRATTRGGTVNWTWNNGTKKATLAVAAADEILGIV